MNKKVSIDLTWVKHGKVEETEPCMRNMLKRLT